MENNSSDKGIQFGFGVQNTDKTKQNEENNKITTQVKSPEPIVTKEDNTDDEEYIDTRSITILPVKNYSLYHRVNDKVLPKRNNFIGSSTSSSRILSSNKEEVEKYFPNLIGLAPNNENFITRVKRYLNNIRIPVDELGKKFDISFKYYHKKDYYKVKAEEDKIDNQYKAVNRQDVSKIKKALKEKVVKLNQLETSKCNLGYPINTEDYLMYRHCLLYKDIAKDIAIINSDINIRFYFKDDKKEAEKLRKFRNEVNAAKANYVTCLADTELFDAIYIQYCLMNNLPIISSLAENRIDREIKLDRFSSEEPVKFNDICKNKDVKLMAIIEQLIARGEIIRSQYNQNITTVDGTFIGANIKEAINWFTNPENNSYVLAFTNKLKNI